MTTLTLLSQNPVIPLATLPTAAGAANLANAITNGGIDIVEVALRSEAAIPAIEEIRRAQPDMTVGAGTVRTPADIERVVSAGAQFAVTPGVTDELLEAAARWDIPLLPGAATPSEIMALAARGFDVIKIFPCHQMGGIDYIRAISGPFPEIGYCPSGGVNAENFIDYLRLDSVVCVSGSWIAPADAVSEDDWDRVERITRTIRHKLDAR